MSDTTRDGIDLAANEREGLADAVRKVLPKPDHGDRLDLSRTANDVWAIYAYKAADAVLAAGWVSPAAVAERDRRLGAVAALLKFAWPDQHGDLVVDVESVQDTLAPVPGAVEGAGEPCAWCDRRATGTAGHNDGQRHPSCGDGGHGLDGTYSPVAGHEQEVRTEERGADNREVRDLLALAHAGELADHLLCIHDNALGRPMDPWSEVAAEVWLLVEEVRRLQRALAARSSGSSAPVQGDKS